MGSRVDGVLIVFTIAVMLCFFGNALLAIGLDGVEGKSLIMWGVNMILIGTILLTLALVSSAFEYYLR